LGVLAYIAGSEADQRPDPLIGQLPQILLETI
jgi:hypothetical protein